jgi:hypothetical protein
MGFLTRQPRMFITLLNAVRKPVIRKSKTIKTALQNEISIRNPQSQP